MKNLRLKGLVLGICVMAIMGCQMDKEKGISDYLRQNPQVVFDILESHPDRMLELLDKTAQNRQKKEFLAYIEKAAQETRLMPSESPARLIFGDPQAPVTITVYSDFFCGYCRTADSVLEQYMVKHPGRARIQPRYYPLDKKDSMLTAVYVEALGRVAPDKARDLYHYLFKQKDLAGNVESFLAEILQSMDTDIEKVLSLAQSEEVQQTVLSDMQEAERLGLTGTPMMIVNGVRIGGSVPLEWFEEAIEIIAAASAKG